MDLFQQCSCNCHYLESRVTGASPLRVTCGINHGQLNAVQKCVCAGCSEKCTVVFAYQFLLWDSPEEDWRAERRADLALSFSRLEVCVQPTHGSPWEVSACWGEVHDTFLSQMPGNEANNSSEAGLMGGITDYSLCTWKSGTYPDGEGAGPMCLMLNLWADPSMVWGWGSKHFLFFPLYNDSI